MTYRNTEAWKYLEKRWGSWINVNSLRRLTSLAHAVSDYFVVEREDYNSVENVVSWFQEYWSMIVDCLNVTIIYDRNGWEVNDEKNKETLKHKPLPPTSPGGQIIMAIVPEIEEYIDRTERYENS